MPSRGQRHLKAYLGKETVVLAGRRKRAREVVPVLQIKSPLKSDSPWTPPRRLGRRQKGLLEALVHATAPTDAAAVEGYVVKRAKLDTIESLVEVLAVVPPGPRAVLLLLEDDATASTVEAALRQRDRALAPVRLSEACTASPGRRAKGTSKGAPTYVGAKFILATPQELLRGAESGRVGEAEWHRIGALVVLLVYPVSAEAALSRQLQGPAAGLPAQRWGQTLAHIRTTCVVSVQDLALVLTPGLNALTVPRRVPTAGKGKAKSGGKDGGECESKSPPEVPPVTPVDVHYTVATGLDRFGFLLALVRALRPGEGLVVHLATAAACGWLFDVLFYYRHQLQELPGHVELLTDYEGDAKGAPAAATDHLTQRFDAVVQGTARAATDHDPAPTAVVLLSCFGVVPASGRIFLAYDLIPDVPNFGNFVRARLVSAVGRRAYQHILLLLRPNEVKGMLRRLNLSAAPLGLVYTALPRAPSRAGYYLATEELKSLNKTLFRIQNQAFFAYKATMTAYSTVGPRDVYDETALNLDKAAEEFGFTETPLLDLRLRDNAFRPREDLYKLSRKKQAEERRAYKRFAQEHIPIDS